MRLVATSGQANQASTCAEHGRITRRRRPARPNHACVTPATIKLRVQRISEGDSIGTLVQRCPAVLSCTKRATFLFPEPRLAVGSGFLTRRTRDQANTFVMA